LTKHTILFLAANPLGTDRLALDREARAIQVELTRSGHRDKFDLVTCWAAEPLDLLRELRRLKPTVVHFSGHGYCYKSRRLGGAELHRDVVGETGVFNGDHQHGLCLQGPDGRPRLVSSTALAETFGAAGSSVKLIVLSACYSQAQAEALLSHVDCVVGIDGPIGDDAARSFATGFYGGLGDGESVDAAYKQGCAAIGLEGLRDGAKPLLKAKETVDPAQFLLTRGSEVLTRESYAGALQYLIYSSRVKVNMLTQQMSPQGTTLTLPDVVFRLRSRQLVGTVEGPREYFEGKLGMRWGPVQFYPARWPASDEAGEEALRSVGSMVLFQGATQKDTNVALIASRCFMTGDPGDSPAQHVAYTNPAFWAKVVAGLSASDKEIQDNMYGMYYGIRGQERKVPVAEVAFVAKTFMHTDKLLLGSPLFVAMA
jgi:hypothetical protein